MAEANLSARMPIGSPAEQGPEGLRFTSPFPAGVAFCWGDAEVLARFPLQEAERALLSGGAVAERVRDLAMGRAAAHEALARLRDDGTAAAPIPRARGRAPAWPAGVVGAITHSGGMAAAAVAEGADYLGVGLDLELAGRGSERLAARILRPEELAVLAALPEPARAARTAITFAAKESIYKALHPATGVPLGFQDAALTGWPEAESIQGERQGAFGWRLFRDVGLGADFRGEGRFMMKGAWVLAAVWVRPPPRDHSPQGAA